jgi:hypothetical protein
MAIAELLKKDQGSLPKFSYSVKLNDQLLVVKQPEEKDLFQPVEVEVPFLKLQPDGPTLLSITRESGDGILFYMVYPKTSQAVSTILPYQKGLTLTWRYELRSQDCSTTLCKTTLTINL